MVSQPLYPLQIITYLSECKPWKYSTSDWFLSIYLFFFSAQLWQLTNNMELVTYYYQTNFKNKKWMLPAEGEEGYIKESSGKVLGLLDGSTESDTEVVLQSKNESMKGGQIWLRGPANSYGWFTLTNPKSNKLLTRHLLILLQKAYIKGL